MHERWRVQNSIRNREHERQNNRYVKKASEPPPQPKQGKKPAEDLHESQGRKKHADSLSAPVDKIIGPIVRISRDLAGRSTDQKCYICKKYGKKMRNISTHQQRRQPHLKNQPSG